MKLQNQRLSKNFTLRELISSSTAVRHGIDNTPSHDQIENLVRLCVETLQPARDQLGEVISISGGFRSKLVNDLVRGAKLSDHQDGNAGDAQAYNNARLFHVLREQRNFHQLIWEFGDEEEPDWIHVSNRGAGRNSRQVLVAYKTKEGKTQYKPWKR